MQHIKFVKTEFVHSWFRFSCQKQVISLSQVFFFKLRQKKGLSPSKVSFFGQCIKKQLITLQNFNIQTCFSQFLWFFSFKCWFKGQIIFRIHLILPNAYKLMCFDRNINGNRDVKFFERDYWSLHWRKKFTLALFNSA